MTTAGAIYDWIDGIAPFSSAMNFDNAGFLVGDRSQPVRKVLLSLDITAEVAAEAKRWGAELIVSHHPVLFTPLRTLSVESPVYCLAKYGIAAICAHTNLDMAAWGVNTCLAERIGLHAVRGMETDPASGASPWFLGELPEAASPEKFAEQVGERLSCRGLRYVAGRSQIRLVGLCSGSGAEFVGAARQAGADAFVTADTRHHQLLEAQAAGITLVDAGHFATEDVVIGPLCKKLEEAFPEVVFRKSEVHQDPAQYLAF